ncbi:hypothetical protein KP509_02G034600 [Ceratopteris richardii]|nr:hypothetical protein KP509_02G034600 [Ceratopteris richardii]
MTPYSEPRFYSNGDSYGYSGAGPSRQPELQIVPYSARPSGDGMHNINRPQTSRSKTISSWNNVLADPEIKRRGRVASYKWYTVEGKTKSSFSRSMRWIKNKYIELRYGLL